MPLNFNMVLPYVLWLFLARLALQNVTIAPGCVIVLLLTEGMITILWCKDISGLRDSLETYDMKPFFA